MRHPSSFLNKIPKIEENTFTVQTSRMISSSDLTTYSFIFGPLCVIILVVTVGYCSICKKGKSQEEKDQKSGKSKDTQHSIYIMTVRP